MIGRCLRPQAGKVAVVLDHVGNLQRLGHHLEEREWTLDGVRKRAKDAAAPAVRICSTCFAAMPATAQACPECGAVQVQKPRELKVLEGELVEVEIAQRQRRREQGSAQTLEQLIEVGRRRGMKNPHGWARHVLEGRQAKRHHPAAS
jgi:superfamily II DNA or RNA helicase